MWWSTQPTHGIDAAAFRAMSQDAIRRHLQNFHAGWHDPIPQILDAAENIVVADTLDVATLPTWSRGRALLIGDAAHATSPTPAKVRHSRWKMRCDSAVDARWSGTRPDLPEF